MMSAPKKVLTAKKPEEAKPVADAGKEGIKGTIHKKSGRTGDAGRRGARGGEARREEVGQEREAVVELGRRRGEEARAEDAQRQRRARRLARSAWRSSR